MQSMEFEMSDLKIPIITLNYLEDIASDNIMQFGLDPKHDMLANCNQAITNHHKDILLIHL